MPWCCTASVWPKKLSGSTLRIPCAPPVTLWPKIWLPFVATVSNSSRKNSVTIAR